MKKVKENRIQEIKQEEKINICSKKLKQRNMNVNIKTK